MAQRHVSIWFRHLVTDWMTIRTPQLLNHPFVLIRESRGRQVIVTVSQTAHAAGITPHTLLADARAMVKGLKDFGWEDDLPAKILTKIAKWCLRFTPAVAVDPEGGIFLDCSGCAHLWQGEQAYLEDITTKLCGFGYTVRAAMADTPGAAWALARFSTSQRIAPPGHSLDAILSLPPMALRIDRPLAERMYSLGLEQIGQFIHLPRGVLRRRFGEILLTRIDQATGQQTELLTYIQPPAPYQERLPCLEPIRTATGIEIALERLLNMMCTRLQQEGRGLRKAILSAYRIDGHLAQIAIQTNHPSHSIRHLFKLFALKIPTLAPGPGVEVFVLQAERVESVKAIQDGIWRKNSGMRDVAIAELLDRVAVNAGEDVIVRYMPQQNYWPELSYTITRDLMAERHHNWPQDWRPVELLHKHLPITVTAPIPDNPPMLFIHAGQRHIVKKADGPERIERPWWTLRGEHRDYYCVEDQDGKRFWIYRLGHYDPEKRATWFIHGYFA